MITLLFLLSCHQKETYKPVQGQWVKGTEEEKLKTIELQFRGFDKAMVEVGYRYQELYWAGEDENWPYANYQLNKIDKAIKLGLERRPKRAKSAEYFLKEVIPQVRQSIKSKSKNQFKEKFEVMRNNCTACHVMESIPTFIVGIPSQRQSPIMR